MNKTSEINMKKFIKFSSLLLAVVFLTALISCTPKEERLRVSEINSKFNFDTNKTFEEYIDYSREIIESGRVDLNSGSEW